MNKFNCPSCGAENTFKLSNSVFVVCPYCKSSLFKSEDQIELIGKVSDLVDDNTPVQLRSSGTYQGKSFSVVGRVRMKWQEGFWNEWYLFFNDGSTAWLSEAQGEFALMREVKQGLEKLPPSAAWEIQKTITLADKKLVIVDLKRSEVLMSEGELPFRAQVGDKRFSADLRGVGGEILGSLEQDAKALNEVRVYFGQIIELSDLKMSYLRTFDGW